MVHKQNKGEIMKTAHYRLGDFTCKAFCRSVGHGYEVGVTFDKKTIFVGNFIHRAEATQWWSIMSKEMHHFTKKYGVTNKSAKSWYGTFISNHLYKNYYKFLDRLFYKYNQVYTKAVTKDVRKFNRIQRDVLRQRRTHLKV